MNTTIRIEPIELSNLTDTFFFDFILTELGFKYSKLGTKYILSLLQLLAKNNCNYITFKEALINLSEQEQISYVTLKKGIYGAFYSLDKDKAISALNRLFNLNCDLDFFYPFDFCEFLVSFYLKQYTAKN